MKTGILIFAGASMCFAQAVPPTPLEQAQAQVAQAQTWLASLSGVIANFQGWASQINGALKTTSADLGQVTAAAPTDPVIAWSQTVSLGDGQSLYQLLQALQKAGASIASIAYTCGQPPAWMARQSYILGSQVEDPAGNIWQLTGAPNGAGQAGGVSPAWPAMPKSGVTVIDESLTWTFVSAPGEMVCAQGAIIPVLQPVSVAVTPQ